MNVVRMTDNVFLALVFLTCLANAQQQVDFTTLSGPVRGERTTVNGKSIDVLLSIPFAKPPTGQLRFKPPQPVDPWTTHLDATKPSPACVQISDFFNLAPGDPRYFAGTFSEDCLYLNIWKPATAVRGSKLPVMVSIYGGGFNYGMKDTDLFSGQFLAAGYDVIVVTLNYRVGIIGFGYLGPDTLPGNLGLLDQLEAMKWVKNNIEYFGGDPYNITIFGESAGSWSIGLHQVSPLSAPYFDKAIMQSGSPLSRILEAIVYPKEDARNNVKTFAGAVGCPTHSDWAIYKCLMNASTDDIIKASDAVILQAVDFYPVVDGYILTEPPLDLMERGLYKKTNLLMGVTKDEYSLVLGYILNPYDFKLYLTGQTLTFDTLKSLFGTLSFTNKWNEKQKVAALTLFYRSSVSDPDADAVQLLVDLGTDLTFACPAHLHASLASMDPSVEVYFYMYNYRMSTVSLPMWAGAPHGTDLEPTYGTPLDNRRNFTNDDREVSRLMMTYWTNFAKSGNPNLPLSVPITWPTFNYTDQFYLALDTERNLATRQGPRRHECAFINEILPKVREDPKNMTSTWPCYLPSGSSSNFPQRMAHITVVVAIAMSLL